MPDFVNSLPCSVFMTLATHVSYVNNLSTRDLRALARNDHMWYVGLFSALVYLNSPDLYDHLPIYVTV